jgi:hypothetical protein
MTKLATYGTYGRKWRLEVKAVKVRIGLGSMSVLDEGLVALEGRGC